MNLTEPKKLVGVTVTAPLVPGHDVKVPHALEPWMQDSSSRLKPERHGDDNPIINDELVSLA